jgi:hypothetical protein
MTTAPDADIPSRVRAIAEGLIRTKRAEHQGVLEDSLLRLKCRTGGYYWISLDGGRVFRGKKLFGADELQPKFIEAMERAGR